MHSARQRAGCIACCSGATQLQQGVREGISLFIRCLML